jgi:hypothetical protein
MESVAHKLEFTWAQTKALPPLLLLSIVRLERPHFE